MSHEKQLLFWASILAVLILVMIGIKKFPETRNAQLETQINRIDLLTCQGEIFGTFYFYPGDDTYSKGEMRFREDRIVFIDYRGREIQYSGNYLVTPIPDTLSN